MLNCRKWRLGLGVLKLSVCMLMLGGVDTAHAGAFEVSGVNVDYKLTLNYGMAVRTGKPSDALINGPINNLQLNPAGYPDGTLFLQNGLSSTINIDDGNRNFARGSLINNRLSGLLETEFSFGRYGMVLSGNGFYDFVYHKRNDNNSPSTVNKSGDANKFTGDARHWDGERARLLDAYLYGSWTIGDESVLNLRVGKHLVAWGESLFFSGLALAQSAADATKAFTPGAEVKDILLPGNQVSGSLSVGRDLLLMGYYKLEFKDSEIFPVGDYFSPSDVVGPGASFAYGAVNPVYLESCPGLLGSYSYLCTLGGGIGGPVLGAPRFIYVPRGPDRRPSEFGQYGVGIKYQVTSLTTLGLYHIRYSDPNPSVDFTTGYPVIATQPVVLTTAIINEPAATSYYQKWFSGIQMTTLSWSTVFDELNLAGEISYRDGMASSVKTRQLGVLAPGFTRGSLGQVLISGLYVTNPNIWFNTLSVVGEVGYVRQFDVDAVQSRPGILAVGNGKELFYDRDSYAVQFLAIPGLSNVFNGWDLNVPISAGAIIKGNPPMGGAFGAFTGQGDIRLSVGGVMSYLQNLQFGFNYNFFFGNPAKTIGDSTLKQLQFADRDYLSVNVKYQF